MKKQKKYLTIHGHFYQPPRENPWTNAIEVQDSAHPIHDWNERIYGECYKPNSCSHILSTEGKISHIVNNYEYLSFNMGPTLLGWIRREHPRSYKRILEADKKSVERLGYGNAIAQVYNHIIMPLASRKDRLTQIRWGVNDFEKHFKRKPESIWLAETGINMDTVVDLIGEGIKYVILAPSQAWRFRKIGDTNWTNSENADIDSHRPYRIFPKDDKGNVLCKGHLDIFFYHDHLSRAVSFQGILGNAQNFNDTIQSQFHISDEPQLINLATDGESYGHHHKHGDMCLSYYFKKMVPYSDVEVVNYSWYLNEFPPEYEVQIKNQWGEGTAWSCAHGVGRWYRDCGCQTGGPEDWNQRWRGPLREAFDHLKNYADKIFEKELKKLCKVDPWVIRDQYVDVLFDYGHPEKHKAFADKYLINPTSSSRTLFLSLLEMQQFAMYSYTSCGWFFNDIEGLEPTQNLKYARRAFELIALVDPKSAIEEEFIDILKRAVSNEHKLNGAEIYKRDAIPERSVDECIIGAALFANNPNEEPFSKTLWKFKVEGKLLRTSTTFKVWEIHLTDNCLLTSKNLLVLTSLSEFQEDVLVLFPQGTNIENIELPDVNFSTHKDACVFYPLASHISVNSLFPDHILDLIKQKSKDSYDQVCNEFIDFPKKYNLFYGLISQNKIKIPEYISTPLRLSLNAQINFYVKELLQSQNFTSMPILKTLINQAKDLKIDIDNSWIQDSIVKSIGLWMREVVDDRKEEHLHQLSNCIHMADIMSIEVDKSEIQNYAFNLFKEYSKANTIQKRTHWNDYLNLFQWLGFQV